MGALNSRLEEDRSLQLCRARKKFIKQALNGRCSLAAAHIAYIEELKIVGASLRRFVEFDAQFEPLAQSSRSVTPELHSLKSVSRSLSQNVDAMANLSPPSSTPVSTLFQTPTKVEERPFVPFAVFVSSTTPLTTTPRSTEVPEASPFETAGAPENSPWDYFGLSHPIEQHFSTQEGRGFDQALEIRHQKAEAGAYEIDNKEAKLSSNGREDTLISDDEFDAPATATLVRRFKNVNRSIENLGNEDSSSFYSKNRVSETMFSSADNVKEIKEDIVNGISSSKLSEISESKLLNGKNNNSPDLSPLLAASTGFVHLNDVKITPVKQTEVEDQVVAKDFLSSMKTIDQLFSKASGLGLEVPKMLEANKLHFRPVIHGKQRGSASLLKSCLSCGDDPSQVPQEPPQETVEFLTWPRTRSSPSASSLNLLGVNYTDGVEDLSNNLFGNFCMVSGSHASTLDRLYAWEKKLYDEVKKCRLLLEQESQEGNTDKTRAAVKGLHSRIRVSVQRIKSISKKIEEIRDRELQPQLEELLEGLRKMWEMMVECHKLQLHTISVSKMPGSTKVIMQSDSRRQVTIHLKNELSYLSSIFTKWINAQKLYVDSINMWLFKCVLLPQNTSKRNKRMRPPPIKNIGPPIYMLCGAWLEMFDKLPSKEVVDSIKDLEVEVAYFLPHQEKKKAKAASTTMLRDEGQAQMPALDRFRTSLAGFIGKLNNFADSSEGMFADLQMEIQEAKKNYELFKSQQS
ncbi:nitrate regulatory gene2 protein-like isoform X2 [Salvia divinorum]|uniref:Nitrate regulatory gene2 protein-like isoform X2 n=1 Tax=Salvia divinorum TaxID=28513 RepID=A0ABD1GLQ9_SALDI